MRKIFLYLLAICGVLPIAQAQDQLGSDVYTTRCAACHENPVADAAHPPPTKSTLATLSSDAIYRALTQGVMRIPASGLSNNDMQAVSEYLTGMPLSTPNLEISMNMCSANSPLQDAKAGPNWNGWGNNLQNTRSALDAGITAQNLPNLRLKWVYGLPGEDQPRAQPVVAGGRLYVGSKAGAIYSMNAKTGCTYWTYLPRTGVRSALSIGAVTLVDGEEVQAIFFQDIRAYVHAINAQNGEELWVTRVEDHPGVRGTGSVTLFDGHVYVPSSGVVEETSSSGPQYGCCTFRGSITKVNANNGEVVWKTYMMPEAQPRGVSAEGVPLFGPAGAGIWSAPTIDVERGLLYTATGNAYGDPAPITSDAVIALDIESGGFEWVNQITPGDTFIGGCDNSDSANCPQVLGPDYDFSASPIITSTNAGRELLIIPQKSGMAYALDPNAQGEKVWEYRWGEGSRSGGIWGMSVADGIAYLGVGGYSNPDSGGIHGINIATGAKAWFSPPQDLLCQAGSGCRSTQSAAVTAIPGAVFSGSADGGMRAYSAEDGKVLWTFDTNPIFESINGVEAQGGSLDASGPVVVDGMMYMLSGNCCIVGRPGNALFAFELEQD